MNDYSIFECIGLPEKDLIATAVVRAIKKADPKRKIVVVSANPEIWLHNPNIFRVYRMGNMAYFYDDYVKDRDTKMYRLDPYQDNAFINSDKHIAEIWCDMYDIPFDGEKPEMFFTQREEEIVGKTVAAASASKGIFMFETHGGIGGRPFKPNTRRDLHQGAASKIVKEVAKMGFTPIQLNGGIEPQIQGLAQLNLPLRQSILALKYADKRLLVHSMHQVGAAALALPSVVLWLENAKRFEYPVNKNIQVKTAGAYHNYLETHPEQYDTPADPKAPQFLEEWQKSFDTDLIVREVKNL